MILVSSLGWTKSKLTFSGLLWPPLNQNGWGFCVPFSASRRFILHGGCVSTRDFIPFLRTSHYAIKAKLGQTKNLSKYFVIHMKFWLQFTPPMAYCGTQLYLRRKKHSEIAKRCPEYISAVVKVSSCSYQKTVVRIWVFEFFHNLSLSFVTIWVLSQFRFLSFVAIWVFKFYWYLSLVTIWVEFCHNLGFCVLSQFEFLSFVAIQIFKFCHNLSF